MENNNHDDGDSPIYAGFGYIGIILEQIKRINDASDEAYANRSLFCLKWLNQLRKLYPLIKNQMDRAELKEEVEFNEIKETDSGTTKKTVKVKKSDKYPKWFDQIEDLIERNTRIKPIPGQDQFFQLKYKNDKNILSELSKCETELLEDANSKHILMPEGRQNMKDLVKKEWIDRARKKEF